MNFASPKTNKHATRIDHHLEMSIEENSLLTPPSRTKAEKVLIDDTVRT